MSYTIVCIYICSLHMVYILNHSIFNLLSLPLYFKHILYIWTKYRYFFRTIFALYFEHLLIILSSFSFFNIFCYLKTLFCVFIFLSVLPYLDLLPPPPISCDIVYFISIHLVDTLDLQHAYFNL